MAYRPVPAAAAVAASQPVCASPAVQASRLARGDRADERQRCGDADRGANPAVKACGEARLPVPANTAVNVAKPSAVTVTAALMLFVYGLVASSDHGWASTRTVASLGAAAALLVIFIE